MAASRPASFIVFAIFNFILAVTFLGCGGCANVGDMASWHVEINGKRFDPDTMKAHLNRELPGYTVIKITGIVLGYLICVGLILAAVTLLVGRWWGGALALLVYAMAFLHHAFSLVYFGFWVLPEMNRFFSQIPAGFLQGIGVLPMIPIYTSMAWWGIGILYYVVAAPLVLWGCLPSRDRDEE